MCGKAGVVDGTTEMSRTFNGVTYTATLPAQVCPHCGESLVEGRDLGRFDAAVTHALAAAGPPDGATVKWLRKAAGLTGAELGALLGVAPESVSRWENDRAPMDRATLHTLGCLAIEHGEGRSDTADELRAMATPPAKRPRTVTVRA